MALASLRKFDGTSVRPLRAHEIGQIAGRAGRYMNDGTFGTTGDAADLDPDIVEQIEGHRFDPVRAIQWRSTDLDFSSVDKLIETLETAPPVKGLVRARASMDLTALRMMADDPAIMDTVSGTKDLEHLWAVCQVPDFRNMTADDHVRLLTSIYTHLQDNNGCLPEDWLSGHLERLDKTDGDIDTLATRIAHVRTWTFVTNRSHWLNDAVQWQERARAIEDRLSDALHEVLTQRFVDRRTSVLLKSLRLKEDLMSEISSDGEVTVEGHYVGRLQGFHFAADPRAGGVDGKALRAAATKALRSMISMRANQLAGAPDNALDLSDHGRIWWQGDPVARLTPGPDSLSPRVDVIGDTELEPAERAAVQNRLQRWVDAHIRKILGTLVDLRDAVAERSPSAPADQAKAAPSPADPAKPAENGASETEPKEESPDTKAAGSLQDSSDTAEAPKADGETSGEVTVAEAGVATEEMAAPGNDNVAQDGAGKASEEAAGSAGDEAAPETVSGDGPSEKEGADQTRADTPSDDKQSAEGEEAGGKAADAVAATVSAPVETPVAAIAAPSVPAPSVSAPASTAQMVGGVAALAGLARGIGYQIVERFGVLDRRDVATQVRDLDQEGRAMLRRFGVRFGQFSIFMPLLLKPAPARLLVTLWAVQNSRFLETSEREGHPPPAPPPPGLCSVPLDGEATKAFYAAAGFRICGTRAVRVDMLERLGDMIRAARDGAAKPAQAKKGTKGKQAAEKPAAEKLAEDKGGASKNAAALNGADGADQTGAVPATPGGDEKAAAEPVEENKTPESAPSGAAASEEAGGAGGEASGAPSADGAAAEPGPDPVQAGDSGVSADGANAASESGASADGEAGGQAPGTESTPETENGPETDKASDTETASAAGQTTDSEKAPDPEKGTEPEKVAEPEKAPEPEVPAGAFRITPDMMSIVGCSGEDFEAILKSLGYRSQSLPVPEGEPFVVWRPQGKREGVKREGGRRDHGRREANRGEGNRARGGQGQRSANGRADGPGNRPGDRSAQAGGPAGGPGAGGGQGARGRSGGGREGDDRRAGGDRQGRGKSRDAGQRDAQGRNGSHRDGFKNGGYRDDGRDQRRKGGGKGPGQGPGGGGKRPRDKDRPFDPDSPFAVLASLKKDGGS